MERIATLLVARWRSVPIALLGVLSVSGCEHSVLTEVPRAQLSLSGPNVVRAPEKRGWIEETRFLLPGEIREGNCIMQRQVALAPGQRIRERVVERDKSTCQFIISRGRYDASTTSSSPTSSGTSSKTTRIQSKSGNTTALSGEDDAPMGGPFAPDEETNSFSSSHTAYIKHWHEDPANIDVTMHRLLVDWSTFANCIENSSSEHDMEWFDGSGWTLLYDDHWAQNQACDGHEHSGEADFENLEFCPGGSTWTSYRALISVTPNNWANMSFSGSDIGDCTWMLHEEWDLSNDGPA